MIIYPVTIKSVNTNRFELSLYQLENGLFMVRSEIVDRNMVTDSQEVKDLKTANDMFEYKLQSLEGN